MERFSPDLILYVAGVDVHENDKLGRLGIDDKGLFEREIMVLTYFKKKGIPPWQRLWGEATRMIGKSLRSAIQQ